MIKVASEIFRNTKNENYSGLITIITREISKASEKGFYRTNVYNYINNSIDSDTRIALKYYFTKLGYRVDTTTAFIILWNEPTL